MGTYTLRVPASRVGYVPEAQGGLPQGPTYCTCGVRVPASGVGYVQRTVATQVKTQQPAYSSSEQPGAGPLSLVQKALAKLYGCYEQLHTGRVGWALEDLTGGVSESIYLRDGVASAFDGAPKQQLQAGQEIVDGTMYTRLATLLEQGHLLGATYKHKYAAEGETPAMACEGETTPDPNPYPSPKPNPRPNPRPRPRPRPRPAP